MQPLPLWAIILGAVVMLVEYFLGKTDLVKPGSIIEVLLTVGDKILKVFLPAKKDDEKK